LFSMHGICAYLSVLNFTHFSSSILACRTCLIFWFEILSPSYFFLHTTQKLHFCYL
jgi:hypothetical protein